MLWRKFWLLRKSNWCLWFNDRLNWSFWSWFRSWRSCHRCSCQSFWGFLFLWLILFFCTWFNWISKDRWLFSRRSCVVLLSDNLLIDCLWLWCLNLRCFSCLLTWSFLRQSSWLRLYCCSSDRCCGRRYNLSLFDRWRWWNFFKWNFNWLCFSFSDF